MKLQTTTGRVLGVDFGDVRTGLAVSDETRFLASGLGTIKPGGIVKTADEVALRARELCVTAIVVGQPVNMDGSLGPRAARAAEFAALLAERLPGVEIALFDERMTTMAASRYLAETGTHGGKKKAVIDTLSAQIILQNALDSQKRSL